MKFSPLFLVLAFILQSSGNPVDLNGADSQTPLRQSSQKVDAYPGFYLNPDEQRLLQFEDGSEVWMTEWEKVIEKAHGSKFFDITDARDLGSFASARLSTPYGPLKHNGTVQAVIKTLSTNGPKANLEKFTSFRTRYYRSDTGRQSQEWLLSRISEITAESASPKIRDSITIEKFPHPWTQSSIIVRINGSSEPDSVIIIGAHQDSTNLLPFLAAPGADDDGSGTVTILEAYRALISAGFMPNKTVEFHWYSAEEGGLLGSQAIARAYESDSVEVHAMIQMDMTAWVKEGTREEAGIVTDYVDSELTDIVKKLVDAYLDIPYVETKCGYACSDHASWGKAGYKSSFAIESAFENSNQNIHSGRDRIDISPEFSFTHMLEFSKLATAFAIELGGWEKA